MEEKILHSSSLTLLMDDPPQFVKRPGEGKLGDKLKVRANFFEVTSLPKGKIIHYDVTITPDVPPRLNRKIFQRFLKDQAETLGGVKPVYDGTYSVYQYRKVIIKTVLFNFFFFGIINAI